jgi:hypothetical protein
MLQPSAHRVILTASSLVLASLVACAERPGPGAAATEAVPLAAASPADSAWARRAPAIEATGEEVLESAVDGRVVSGRRHAVPERSTARLRFESVLHRADGTRVPLPGGDRLQDARFAPAPASRLALLDGQDRLVIWEPDTGRVIPVADGAFPGFAFSPDGKVLAYSAGDGPDLDAFRYDLASGQSTRLTRGDGPTWGFAFSPDGQHLAFVHSPEGFPSLHTMTVAGRDLRRLGNAGLRRGDRLAGALAPFPDGRRPPLWVGDRLILEGQGRVAAVDLRGRVVWSVPEASAPHVARDGSLVLRTGAGWQRVTR